MYKFSVVELMMSELIGVKWGNLEEITKEYLLSNANYEGTGECIIDLTGDLSIAGEIVDNDEEMEIVIKDEAIIYKPNDGIISETTECSFVINEVMTVSEAAEIWGKTEGAIRAAIKAKKFIAGVDYRKAKGTTLITKKSMERVYGKRN